MQLEQIWALYRTSLKAFLQARLSNSADVDDLLQEILIKTHRKLNTLEQAQSIKPWLFQIANNTLIDFYRSRSKTFDEIAVVDALYNQPEEDVKQQLTQCLDPFINALPDSQARLLRAVDLNGESQKAYATRSNLSYSTLKSQVQQSRRALADLFNQCCHYTLDQRGNLVDYEQRQDSCHKCK